MLLLDVWRGALIRNLLRRIHPLNQLTLILTTILQLSTCLTRKCIVLKLEEQLPTSRPCARGRPRPAHAHVYARVGLYHYPPTILPSIHVHACINVVHACIHVVHSCIHVIHVVQAYIHVYINPSIRTYCYKYIHTHTSH